MSINFDPQTLPQANELNGHNVVKAQPSHDATPGGLLRRLAAQCRGRVARQETGAHESDPLARPRDKAGNPMQRVHIGVVPAMPSARPVEETRLKAVLEALSVAFPVRANQLWCDYNESIQEELRRYQDKVRQVWADVEAYNAETQRHNAALEARKAELEAERDTATHQDREAMETLDRTLAQAHRDAGEAVALAGGAYSPSEPSEECVLRHTPRSLRELAGGRQIPFPEEGVLKLWKLPSEIATLLAGVLLGTSFGVAIGMVDVEQALEGEPASFLSWLLFAGFGWGFAVKIRSKIWKLFHDAGERQGLGLPLSSWAPSLGISILLAAVVVALLCFIEQFGLLKLAALIEGTGGGGQAVSAIGALAMGATSLFFVGATAVDGWMEGHRNGALNRLSSLQVQEFEERDALVRRNPAVQEALHKIADVKGLLQERAGLESRVLTVSEPYDTQIFEAESQKRELRDGLSAETQLLLQDAFDNWHLANTVWVRQLEELISEVEPLGHGESFWGRLLRALSGKPPVKQRHSDKKRQA